MLQMIGEDEWNQIQVAGPTFKTQMIVAGCFAVLWGSFFEVLVITKQNEHKLITMI